MPNFQVIANYKVEAEKRGAANSTYLTFFDLGIGASMLLVGYLIQIMNYLGAFILCASIEMLALVVIIFYIMPKFRAASITDVL